MLHIIFFGSPSAHFVLRMTIEMLVIILFFSTCSALTRFDIDYNTIVGNCTPECPVFGKPIDGYRIGCYGKMMLVEKIRPWQSIQFFDVNSPQWFHFRYVTKVMYFDEY